MNTRGWSTNRAWKEYGINSSPQLKRAAYNTTAKCAWVLIPVACCLFAVYLTARAHSGPGRPPSQTVTSLAALRALPLGQLSQLDIARINLLCAEGLSGTDAQTMEACLAQLDAMASRVRSETKRHWYRLERNPAEFEGSAGFFRMLLLTVVLTEDFGVHYNPSSRVSPESSSEKDGFFADARDVFLSGLLGPNRQGTCSSLPVLYVAVGRRLGYPLKLVTTKGHLFLRWDGAGERFNVEATGHGLNRFGDDYYRQWPFPVTEEEVAAEGYLKSLTPAEELAVFLSIRGMCLLEAGQLPAASATFGAAAGLAPHCQGYRMMQNRLPGRLALASRLPGMAPGPRRHEATNNMLPLAPESATQPHIEH